MELIIPRLQELAKDSHKYHAKKDRKVQKSSFRDILKYIEDEEDFYERIAFSKREKLEIESWGMKKQYDQMCKVNNSLCILTKKLYILCEKSSAVNFSCFILAQRARKLKKVQAKKGREIK